MIKKQVLKKQEKVEYIKRNVNESSAVIFYNFSHADNGEIFLLKKRLREVKSEWFVCKNTLFKRAVSDRKLQLQISNSNAFVFCKSDQYEPLKILNDFSFRRDLVERIQGGIYDGTFTSRQKLTEWASLKSRKTLLSDFCNLLVFGVFNLTMLLEAIASK